MFKILRLGLIVGFLAIALSLVGSSVIAQEDTTNTNTEVYEDISEPFLKPDSPFYFLRHWQEGAEKFLVRSEEAKANLEVKFAQRRVGEMRYLARTGRKELLEKTRARWEEHLQRAQERAERVKERRDEVRERILEATDRHRMVLEKASERAPEEAKEGLRRAIENSGKVREKILERLPSELREKTKDRLKQRLEKSIDRFQLRRDRFKGILEKRREQIRDRIEERPNDRLDRQSP
ncbi:MAG: hypothetical protein BMS9Abin34_216 [Patescibacteria group bacterium]|nr:MAG: hypothetical protein BMS9Abin34_216 [Patescibacteria group bacterium]